MEMKLGLLRRYTKVSFYSCLALTYRRSPAVGFDGKEGGFNVLTGPYIGETNYSDMLSIKPFKLELWNLTYVSLDT